LGPDHAPLKIDGIDTEAGLKRLGGKRERYESLLRKFAARQAGTVEAIRAALSSGDTAMAERDAHSLKSSAATVGADRLAEEAAKAEAAIKSGYAVEEALLALSRALDGVVVAIRTALPE
jgi:two-component system, sensor histidine kinase and response regulator